MQYNPASPFVPIYEYRHNGHSRFLRRQEMARQIAYNRANGNVDGSIFYGYSALKNNVLGIKDSVTGLFE